MLKKLKNLAHPDLLRFALKVLLIICAVAVALTLYWDHNRNKSTLVLWPHAMAVLGFFYGIVAWFYYLALDGFSPFRAVKQANDLKQDSKFTHTLRGEKRDKGSMTEHIYTPQDESSVRSDMEPQDRYLCYFAAFLASAVLLQIPSLFSQLLR